MVLAVEEDDLGIDAVHLKGREHLERIAHPAAIILVRLDKEGRCLSKMAILEGRRIPDNIEVMPGIGGQLGHVVAITDIGRQRLCKIVGY